MRIKILLVLFVASLKTNAQITGGESIMQFLRLSNSAHASGMGGMCVSNPSKDVMLGLSNPSLLRPEFHNNLGMSQNFYLAGSKISNVVYAFYNKKTKTTFATSLVYLNYGTMNATTDNGQINSTFNSTDMAFQISASRKYLNKWQYGAALKIANSKMFFYNSLALLGDFGLHYSDTAKQFYFGMVAKNIGFELKRFNKNAPSAPLPFDMQIGVSKKLLKAPFRFNAIAHHTNLFNNDTTTKTKYYFGDKLFRHFNFGVDVLLGKALEINVGYSHQRRMELAYDQRKGMAGFSFGLGLNFTKLQLHYARNIYSLAGNYNEIGINFNLKETFGIGRKIIL
jgi:hypothetical protein